MRIGIDAKRAFNNQTGLGNYSRNFISALSTFFPENQYLIFTPKINQKFSYFQTDILEHSRIITPKIKMFKSVWRSFKIHTLIQQNQCDIYHGLSAELPFGGKSGKTKYVVTIHDLIFERFPKLYPFWDKKIYRFKTKYACKKADRIIAISEQTKRDIVHYLNVPSEKIDVVYQCCDSSFSLMVADSLKESIRNKYQLPEKFLLTVGTIEKRKNFAVILQAIKELDLNVKLVIVGKITPYIEELKKLIIENQIEKRVLFLHDVKLEELPTIYQLSTIFIYPSIFEGFGIPILEALNCNVPVIAAKGSSLEEVGGKTSLYFDANDSKMLAQQIQTVLENNDVREKMIEGGKKHANLFSFKNFAKSTMDVYQKCLSK